MFLLHGSCALSLSPALLQNLPFAAFWHPFLPLAAAAECSHGEELCLPLSTHATLQQPGKDSHMEKEQASSTRMVLNKAWEK